MSATNLTVSLFLILKSPSNICLCFYIYVQHIYHTNTKLLINHVFRKLVSLHTLYWQQDKVWGKQLLSFVSKHKVLISIFPWGALLWSLENFWRINVKLSKVHCVFFTYIQMHNVHLQIFFIYCISVFLFFPLLKLSDKR